MSIPERPVRWPPWPRRTPCPPRPAPCPCSACPPACCSPPAPPAQIGGTRGVVIGHSIWWLITVHSVTIHLRSVTIHLFLVTSQRARATSLSTLHPRCQKLNHRTQNSLLRSVCSPRTSPRFEMARFMQGEDWEVCQTSKTYSSSRPGKKDLLSKWPCLQNNFKSRVSLSNHDNWLHIGKTFLHKIRT